MTLQDLCPTDIADHIAMFADPVALHETENALDPANAERLWDTALSLLPA